MSKIGIIISREYSKRVRKKSFLLGTILVPILFAALIIVPAVIATLGNKSKADHLIAVADASGIVAGNLKDTANLTYKAIDAGEIESVKKDIEEDGEFFALLQISPLDSSNNAALSLYSKEQINIGEQMNIESQINDILKLNKVRSYDIPELNVIMDNIQSDSRIKTFKFDKKKDEEKDTSVGAYMGI